MKRIIIIISACMFALNIYAQKTIIFQDPTTGLSGLKLSTGAVIMQPAYDEIWDFRNDIYAQTKLNGLTGIINNLGKEILPTKYEHISIYAGGFFEVKLNGKYGFINKDGVTVVPIIYDKTLVTNVFTKEGFITVVKDNKYGCINKAGEVVIPIIYDEMTFYTKELTKVGIYDNPKGYGMKYGLIDNTGKVIVPIKYSVLESYNEDLAKVKIDDKVGYINKMGAEVITVKYSFIQYFNRDMFANMKLNGKMGLLNREGKEVIPALYDNLSDYKVGVRNFYAERNGLKGMVNIQGVEIIPFIYNDIQSEVKEGLIGAELKDKWGFLDILTGKTVIPFKFLRVERFYEGKAKVRLENGDDTYINKLGEVVGE